MCVSKSVPLSIIIAEMQISSLLQYMYKNSIQLQNNKHYARMIGGESNLIHVPSTQQFEYCLL